MKIKKCRACGNNFYKSNLLELSNMPRAAQHMPDKKGLSADQGVKLELKQCAACSIVQLINEPVPYYRDVIRASSVSGAMKTFRAGQFRRFVKKYELTGKKILEIGCGRGDYLSIMSKTGAISYGLENNKHSVDYCRKNGLKAIRGFVNNESYRIKEGPFDGFYIMSFLEHLPDLRTVLAGIRNNLNHGAVGIIEVPNFDMMLQKKLYAEIIIDHLFYFTKDTLTTCLSNNGFDVLECRPVWHDYILSAIVKKKRAVPMNDASLYFAKLKKEINSYINSIRKKGGKVAIWGAGHQAFTVMSICELSGKIDYVVDSAPFKQGKFTPATHIPIVSPGNLDSNTVNAVIVMAGSYSGEIAGIIRKKYGSALECVILQDYRLEKCC
jgi:2-polyprenyl-3-methyl-5-hydroxy-6-metoxy-1,4-benzoquinol methylase